MNNSESMYYQEAEKSAYSSNISLDDQTLGDNYNSEKYKMDVKNMEQQMMIRSWSRGDSNRRIQESSRTPPSKINFFPVDLKEVEFHSPEEQEQENRQQKPIQPSVRDNSKLILRAHTIMEERSFPSCSSSSSSVKNDSKFVCPVSVDTALCTTEV